MMKLNKYIFYPGKHVPKLWGRVWEVPVLKKNPFQIIWRVRVDDLRYTLPYPENRDINKGGGISFDLLTNHGDSAMWGWRYFADEDKVQFFTYCHVNGETVKGGYMLPLIRPDDKEVAIELPHDDDAVIAISLKINYDRKVYVFNYTIDEQRGYAQVSETPFTHDKVRGRTIGPWFGGKNNTTGKLTTAPRKLEMYIGRAISK